MSVDTPWVTRSYRPRCLRRPVRLQSGNKADTTDVFNYMRLNVMTVDSLMDEETPCPPSS